MFPRFISPFGIGELVILNGTRKTDFELLESLKLHLSFVVKLLVELGVKEESICFVNAIFLLTSEFVFLVRS